MPSINTPDTAANTADDAAELFDTYDINGTKLQPRRRGEVHARGIWHRAVNVMLFRSNGDLVLQRRAAGKSVCPLSWDLSVAEHLQVDEDWEAAAHRGLAEELGLTGITLSAWGPEIQERHDDPDNRLHNYEIQRCYRGVSDALATIDLAEVAELRQLSIARFQEEAASEPQQFTPWLLTWAQQLGLLGG